MHLLSASAQNLADGSDRSEGAAVGSSLGEDSENKENCSGSTAHHVVRCRCRTGDPCDPRADQGFSYCSKKKKACRSRLLMSVGNKDGGSGSVGAFGEVEAKHFRERKLGRAQH